jgi:hypothetical protein
VTDLRSTRELHRAESAGRGFVQSSVFEWLSRAGFVARAAVYAVIGILALKLAIGAGGKVTNQQGAMRTLAHQPFGKYLLTLLAIGLGGYALWRLVRAAIGHGPEGSDSGLDRLAALASGIAYAVLCAIAIEILAGSGSAGGNPKSSSAGVLGWPGGQEVVGAIGAGLIGVGLYQIYRGSTREFMEDSKEEEMSPGVRTWFGVVGVVGYLARGVVFGLIGVFLIRAAVDFDPAKAVGVDGALAKLEHASYGPVLLGVVAAGLIAFALYSLADARYRRI